MPQQGGQGSTTVQSRRTHTKSRKGCQTCKNRHIRCDETSPQCKNCTKHNVRCDYMDVDLDITPTIQRALDSWRNTGVYPFPSLNIAVENLPSPAHFSAANLRLIHHISSVAQSITSSEGATGRYAVWTRRVPLFLSMASTHKFVMDSLLGLSASHLSWVTRSSATLHLAYQHQGEAFAGLQKALGQFCRENSDAVLAASILLSWQVTDWASWASLMRGTTSVIDAMSAWKHQSLFRDYLTEKELFSGTVRPNAHPSRARDEQTIFRLLSALQPLQQYLAPDEESSRLLREILHFIHHLQQYVPIVDPNEQFEKLQPLRDWIFFTPLDMRNRRGLRSLVLLAHIFGVALAVEPLFPEIGPAWFGTTCVAPVEEIHKTLREYLRTQEGVDAVRWMKFPLEMVQHFRHRMGFQPGSVVRARTGYGV